MAIRTYKVTLDSKNSIAPEPVLLRQGDKTGAVVIDATLMDNGSPVSLSGLTPMFKANTADGQAVIADSTGFKVTDSVNGKFTYQVPNALSAIPGKITTAYFSLSDADGSESTFDVAFIIKAAVDISQRQAEDYITIIDGTINSLQKKIDAMNTDIQTILNAYNMVSGHLDIVRNSSWIYNNTKSLSAHRGAHIDAPENTAMAVAHAGLYGYGLIECDPRLTSDNQVVLMHDDTVDRMTDGTGNVSDFTLNQLKQMTVDASFSGKNDYNTNRVPTLAEILHEVNQYGMGINIDGSKLNWQDDNVINTVVGIIKQAGLMGRSFFVISDQAARKRLNALYPDAALSWLYYDTIDNYIAEAKTYTNAVLSISYSNLSRDYSAIAASGLPLHVYGVNTTSQYYDSVQHGARFIETDLLLPMTVTPA